MSSRYDEVPYDTEANPEAHPRSMATQARLFGREAAAPSTARVLEIGCGDGEHMIAAASYLPRARFVGFDLAADAVARGVAAARASGVGNVELQHRDVRDVTDVPASGLCGEGGAPFDYVVAHGVYSWVPEAVRGDVLAVMKSALGPQGIGFLSVNAGPGWELRRALRVLMREAAAEHADAAGQVRAALALVDELASSDPSADGFPGILARAAQEYRAHVTQATPPDAPFSHYVFHDLLAECNDPFTVTELETRLRAAGLRILCETPLGEARARAVARAPAEEHPGLAADMARSGSPFLQVLVCHDDAGPHASAPNTAAVRTLFLWADLAPAPGGALRTTTGATLMPSGDQGLARAAKSAPGFVAVSSLADDEDTLARLERDLLAASCGGILTLVSEPPSIRGAGASPRVSPRVLHLARAAAERGAASAVLTSALHRSFRVPLAELLVVRELDGRTDAGTVIARVGESGTNAAQLVSTVIDRLARYGFLVDGTEASS